MAIMVNPSLTSLMTPFRPTSPLITPTPTPNPLSITTIKILPIKILPILRITITITLILNLILNHRYFIILRFLTI